MLSREHPQLLRRERARASSSPADRRHGQGEAVVDNEPVGVLLAIEPWNYPLYQVVRVAGPNLVLGNAILLKHAEINPQTALAIEQLFRDAGVPEGVYTNVFLKISDAEQVIADPRVQGVTLTGSERAGSSVAALAGKHLKKSVLELGGSDPFVVLDADDLGAHGQGRDHGPDAEHRPGVHRRQAVHRDRRGLRRLRRRPAAGLLRPSPPATRPTRRRRWPRCPPSAPRRTCTRRSRTPSTRAPRCVTGGGRPEHAGAFVEPTLLTDVTPEMRAYREELFGPAAVVYKVSNEDEAVALANDSHVRPQRHGLRQRRSTGPRGRPSASRPAWCGSTSRPASSPELPFGGVKRSGYGRELSELGMFEFANRRLVRVAPGEEGREAGRPAEAVR